MSDKSNWDLVSWLRFWVADMAMRFCGPEHLYWTAADEWDEYMSQGQPRPTWTPVPPPVFGDIAMLCDESQDTEAAGRVLEWLFGQQVTIKDANP